VLVLAQAILGSQMPMIFVIGGLAGLMIAPSPALATIPISLIVFGSMTTAPWLSAVMQRFGRRIGFFIGCLGGALGGAVSAWGLWIDDFAIFLVGAYLTGIYMSAQGFYRFAAADSASDGFRPKAISYVMAGGLISALIGPQLVKVTTDATVVPFFGTYVVVVAHQPRGRRAVPRARPAQTGPAARGRARGPHADGASERPEDRRGDHLRHGLLRADEPDDDLDAAGDGRAAATPPARRPTWSRPMSSRCSRRPFSPAT
jgi:hypothetical protein